MVLERVHQDRRAIPQKPPSEDTRKWLSGLAITVTALLGLFGFWHLAPGATFAVACLAIVALVISFWFAGGDD